MRPCPEHDRLECPMTRINRVNGEGKVPCSIMLIGEAPGQTEDKMGKPFVGKSGSELTHLYLAECAGVDRRNVYVTNLVKCRCNDRDRDPTQKEIEACSQILRQEVLDVQPRFIGLVGRLSTQFMLSRSFIGMEKMHGFGYELPVMFGDTIHDGKFYLVMPLYHPAYGLHNTPMMRHIMEDFRRFGRMVRGDDGVMWRARTCGW